MLRSGCSSPHTRRYFRGQGRVMSGFVLFSAHAEVFPPVSIESAASRALLRTRGGISWQVGTGNTLGTSSPHTRRYFLGECPNRYGERLFSAHAEVFPSLLMMALWYMPLLRTRGGISEPPAPRFNVEFSSPHTRRYFHSCHRLSLKCALFSAHAEVFP